MFAEAGQDRHAEQEVAADTGGELHPAVQALMLEGDQVASECAFAYDVSTGVGRELGHVDRKYAGLAPYEIPGTVDLVIRGSGRAVVVDYKSFEAVDAASENAQLATYALMVARTYGLDEVTVAIVYLAGFHRPDVATLGPLDLDAHAQRLRKLHGDVARAAADPERYLSTGKHCRYCPAFLSCPRQADLRADVANESIAVRVEAMIPFGDDESAADAFDLLQRIKTLTTRMTAALYARAAERPIPLRDGTVLGERQKQGNESLDGDVTYQVIRERHGQAIADAAVERKASKKQIKEALKLAGVAGEVAKLERAVIDEVRARGGSRRETKTVIERYTPEIEVKCIEALT